MRQQFFISCGLLLVLIAFSVAAAPSAVEAQARPQKIGEFRDWSAFVFEDQNGKVCYMASQPVSDEGNYTRRGEIYGMITHRPDERAFDVVSFVAGYTHRAGSEVTAQIGSDEFELFTQGDTSWTRDAETDARLVEAIRRGSRMVVRGTSSRGTATTDTYSLFGSSAAYDAISEACGVRS